jgi:anhydro-N-acetylmuramic acid kinase
MSGTSLDGLDIAYCKFRHHKKGWEFSIKKAVTLKYGKEWTAKLKNAHKLSSSKLLELHNEYGRFLGRGVKQFIKENEISKIDFIASHGHTIFHQPEKKITFQLGHGAAISAASGLNVVSDFRSLDIALGGQGAPLVPIGDRLLFSEYTYCLNLGGFANISYEHTGNRIAFDICSVNIVLNHIAQLLNKEYDNEGKIAAKGKVNRQLLQKLNGLDYYKKAFPKSLGREWLEEEFMPLMQVNISAQDKMATMAEHIAMQITSVIKGKGSLLITGGGAFNTHLIKRIKELSPKIKLVVPGKEIVNYKEALVFALLGVLRWRGEVNCLKSVTGASENNSGGSVFLAS